MELIVIYLYIMNANAAFHKSLNHTWSAHAGSICAQNTELAMVNYECLGTTVATACASRRKSSVLVKDFDHEILCNNISLKGLNHLYFYCPILSSFDHSST